MFAIYNTQIRDAWYYFNNGKVDFGIEILTIALESAKGNDLALTKIMTALYKMFLFKKDYDMAERFALKLLEIDCSEINLGYLGEVFRKSKQYEKALAVFSKLPNHNYHRWVRSGYCYMHLMNFEKSFFCFQQALELTENNSQIEEDLRLRLYTGILFLIDSMIKNSEEVGGRHALACLATQRLRSYPEEKVSEWQKRDYKNALEIARLYRL